MSTNYRHYGIHYEATKDMKIKEVAAHMRRVVKQAAKDELINSGYDYSVRLRRATWSYAIDVYMIVPDELHDLIGEWQRQGHPSYGQWATEEMDAHPRWEPLKELRATEAMLNEIHRSYNYDGSDVMTDYFDVRFYGTVKVVSRTDWNRFYK